MSLTENLPKEFKSFLANKSEYDVDFFENEFKNNNMIAVGEQCYSNQLGEDECDKFFDAIFRIVVFPREKEWYFGIGTTKDGYETMLFTTRVKEPAIQYIEYKKFAIDVYYSHVHFEERIDQFNRCEWFDMFERLDLWKIQKDDRDWLETTFTNEDGTLVKRFEVNGLVIFKISIQPFRHFIHLVIYERKNDQSLLHRNENIFMDNTILLERDRIELRENTFMETLKSNFFLVDSQFKLCFYCENFD